MGVEDRERPTVVAVVGSPRVRGNTATVVAEVAGELEHLGVACETLHLVDYRIEPCEGHDTCGELDPCPLGDDMDSVLERVYAADGLILASPVYYENVSAQMKAFIDRNVWEYSRERWLEPHVVGLVAIAGETGLDDTIDALRRFVNLSSQREIPVETLTGIAYELDEAAASPALMDDARAFATRLAGYLRQTDDDPVTG